MEFLAQSLFRKTLFARTLSSRLRQQKLSIGTTSPQRGPARPALLKLKKHARRTSGAQLGLGVALLSVGLTAVLYTMLRAEFSRIESGFDRRDRHRAKFRLPRSDPELAGLLQEEFLIE